jgi:hypothetical protein
LRDDSLIRIDSLGLPPQRLRTTGRKAPLNQSVVAPLAMTLDAVYATGRSRAARSPKGRFPDAI